MTVVLVFFMMSTFIWSMKRLAILSMIGNVFIFVGLVSITVSLFKDAKYDNLRDIYIGHITDLPLFFSMAIYSFEAIGKF